MKQNLMKQRIRRGEPTIGTWLSLSSVIAAERMAVAGFDWLTIDLEHAPTNWETAMAMVAVVGAQGVADDALAHQRRGGKRHYSGG